MLGGAGPGAKLAERQGEKAYAQKWRVIAEEIKADILQHGVNAKGVFTQHYGADALDASLLMVVLTRFLPPMTPGAQHRAGHRRRTHRTGLGVALPR
ncbi:glycoside hydrolase family protein [Mycobacterium xenopi 4042]|uniref:Glycoside hydrolase family protein n=1 Tax=Mycobacterium xenopi 4042 TaxID=1299334 RepID=X8AQJ8_MYCXE|nr:glycoside hydrolase family protein [Mycobacterium xenopi 4042]